MRTTLLYTLGVAFRCLFVLSVYFPVALAQLSSSKEQFEIHSISFHGNQTFDDETLRKVVLSKETPGAFSRFLYRTFGEKLGAKPEYFSDDTFSGDENRLGTFYREQGFYDTRISSQAKLDSGNRCADLTFDVIENARTYVDKVVFHGLDSLPAEISTELFRDCRIQSGMPYIRVLADAEIARVVEFLENHGYPLAHIDIEHSMARRQTSKKNVDLIFTFVLGRTYEFGEATVHVDPPRDDITNELVLRQLDFEKGEPYSREKQISSERNLNRLDLFENVRIDHLRLTDSSTSSTVVPMDVFVRPRSRNEISPELSVSDENNAFNLGIGLGYTNRNFFGDARTLSTHARIRTQSIQNWDFSHVFGAQGFRDPSVVGALELQSQILQPYIFSKNMSGTWTLSASAEKQQPYILSILRNRIGLSDRFATYTYGLLDWTLERVSPEILGDTTDQETRAALSRQENQPQFNSILTLTLQRDKTNDIFSPTEGSFNSITLEESGILPKLLPGMRGALPFTQYYKLALFGRWYQDLTATRYNILALKVRTGYQEKYGESKYEDVNIPLNRRFFGGGSGSVRGWRPRELGAMPDSLLQFGGNFILEASAEMRIHYFRGYGNLMGLRLDNIWIVYFVDVGNVWSDIVDFKPREIAAAAGVGFRYETFFGPFRIDYGFRVYDPKEISGRQTIFQKKLLAETLGNGVFHFGIGHAF